MKTLNFMSKIKMTVIALMITLSIQAYTVTSVYAQDNQNRLEQMLKEHIGNRLDLSGDEASTFWPLYNEYRDAKVQVHEQMRAAQGSDATISLEEKMVTLKRDFNGRFNEILSDSQVTTLYEAEKEFRDEVMKAILNNK